VNILFAFVLAAVLALSPALVAQERFDASSASQNPPVTYSSPAQQQRLAPRTRPNKEGQREKGKEKQLRFSTAGFWLDRLLQESILEAAQHGLAVYPKQSRRGQGIAVYSSPTHQELRLGARLSNSPIAAADCFRGGV